MRSAGYEPSLSSLRNFNLKPTQVEARALGLGVTGESEEDPSDPADTVDPAWSSAAPVTKPCDLWELGDHHLLCGNARSESDLARLMSGSQAAMAFLDPPYNVRAWRSCDGVLRWRRSLRLHRLAPHWRAP